MASMEVMLEVRLVDLLLNRQAVGRQATPQQ
jgi:hypothetical protein